MKVTVQTILAFFLMSITLVAYGEDEIFVPFNFKNGNFCAKFYGELHCAIRIIEEDGMPTIIEFDTKKEKLSCTIHDKDILKCWDSQNQCGQVSKPTSGNGPC